MLRRVREAGRAIAPLVSTLALVLGTVPVAAAEPPAPAPTSTEAPDPAIERARELYGRGRAKYETFDYTGAIELWTQAYDMLPDAEEYAEIRGKLMFNLAAARLEAFDIDEKVSHLRQAQRLMDIYVASLGPENEADAAEAQQWQARIADRLAQAERSAALRGNEGRSDAPAPVDPRAAKRARALTIAGATVLAIGVAGLGAMGGGLGWGAKLEADARRDADAVPVPPASDFDRVVRRGHAANGLAIAGAVVGGVAITAGVVMLAIGLRGRSKRTSAAWRIDGGGLAWRF